MIFPSLPHARWFMTSAAVYSVVSLLSTQTPLLNYLGYEFSALVALLASLLSGILTIGVLRRTIAVPRAAGRAAARHGMDALRYSLLLNMILLVIPLGVMLANAMFVKNCSFLEGIGFFLLLPGVSVVFASSLGFFCAVQYRFSTTVFLLLFLATLAYTGFLGYSTPAIYSYNFFYGYFPGVTYDEALGLHWTLILFRLLTVVFAGVLVWLGVLLLGNTAVTDSTWKKGATLLKLLLQMPRVLGSLAVIALLVLAYAYRCELGFESHKDFIRNVLGKKYETEHFSIYYSVESYTDDEIRWIGTEHEFQLHQILSMINLPYRGRIESFIYPSDQAKQRLIGAGMTDIAKPWSGQIHISKQSLNGTLRHELVHVLAAPFGVPVLKASLSSGLVEGLAMAVEWSWGNRTLHQYAAGMYRFGGAPDIRRLMSFTGFAMQSSAVSYVLTGSFCRYLIDRYGIRRMAQVYKSGDYAFVYGRSLGELTDEWRKFLERLSVRESDRDAIDVLFRRPAIFQKVCARVIAKRNMEARAKFAGKDYAQAAELYLLAYQESKGYEALSGYLSSALRLRRYDVLSSVLDTIIMKDAHLGQYLPLFVPIGDAFWAQDDAGRAYDLYTRVRGAGISEALTETATIRSFALTDTANASHLRSYFLSDVSDTLRRVTLDSMVQRDSKSWIPRYLQAKVLQRMNKFQESLALLRSFSLRNMDDYLEGIRWKLEGYALFRLKRFQEAKSAYWSSLNYDGTEAALDHVNEWLDRCDWMSLHPVP